MKHFAFASGDYHELFGEWWEAHHGSRILPAALAKTGVAVLDHDVPVAISYLYPTIGSGICWVGFTARDPGIGAHKAGKALKLLMAGCEETISLMGYAVAYATFDKKALHKLAEKRGFTRGSDVREYFKELR